MVYYAVMKQYTFRWRIVGAFVVAWIALVFCFSRSPVSTLVTFGGVDASAGWYREAIWATAGPMVLDSPMFGIGSIAGAGWWEDDPVLTGPTMDSVWLVSAFQYGIPCCLLIMLTIAGAFWLGPLDTASSLSESERRLSVALGIAMTLAGVLGFIVHMWGPPWVLLGVFSGTRAYLAEAAIVRERSSYRGQG
jgi:O-antigen ligase